MQNHEIYAQRFIDCYQQVKKAFPFENTYMHKFGALLIANSETIDLEKIKSSRALLKVETSVFSQFRGINAFSIAIQLSLNNDPSALLSKTKAVYEFLKASKFHSSVQLPMAALIIAKETQMPSDRLVERAADFYKGMKANHAWITGTDDYVYASLLAVSNLPVDTALATMENHYQDLSSHGFTKGNGLQSLTHVMTLSPLSYQEIQARVIDLDHGIKQAGFKLTQYYMPLLGVAAFLPLEIDEIIHQALYYENWLKSQKGFGAFSVDKKMRMGFAISLMVQQHIEGAQRGNSEAVLGNSLQALIIAQQVAMVAIIASTSAASASASAGSS